MALIVTALLLASGLFLVSASACIPGERSAVDCERYKECMSGGQEKLFKCPVFHRFDPGILASGAAGCAPGVRTPIDGSCKYYIECSSSGEETVQSCGFGKLFNPKTRDCEMSYNVDCVDKHQECDDGKTYSHPDSCRLYYTCAGRRLAVQFCPLLEVFDSETGSCKFGWGCRSVDCAGSQRRAALNDCSSYEQCENGAWTKKSCLPLERYRLNTEDCKVGGCDQCSEGDVRRVASDCSKYQQCSRGVWLDRSCSTLYRFDPDKKECVLFFQYTCKNSVSFKASAENCTDGARKPADDCSKYSVCSEGKWGAATCPVTQLFDATTLTCVPRDEAMCSKGCKEGTKKPNLYDCRKYYVCSNGSVAEDSCVWPRKFDSVELRCVWYGANCAKPK